MTTHKYAITLALAAAASFAAAEAGSDTVGRGNLVSGEKFGLSIGQMASDVQGTLWTEGFGYLGTTACAANEFVRCAPGDTVMTFQPVELGRKGTLVLKIENGRIAEIGWDFKIVPQLEG